MSQSFTKKTVAEVLPLFAGAGIAAVGKQQESAALLGLGIVVIGAGVTLGGIGAIRHRRLVFLHREARFITHRFTGGAAMLWGVFFLLIGLALMVGGVAVAIGQQAELRELVMQPGTWMLGGGVALFFVVAAALVQRAQDGEHSGLRVILALPGYGLGVLGILLAVAMAGTGVWGLRDPDALLRVTHDIRIAAQDWLSKI